MRWFITPGILLLAAVGSFGSKKVVSPETSAGNDQIDVVATITLMEEEVAQKIGADPGKGIVLLQVRVIPKTDKPVQVSPDDFILLAHDDGERSKPFSPSELAGRGALVVTDKKVAPGSKTGISGGFGGMMGSGGSPGNPKVDTITAQMDTKSKGNDKLLEALKAKQFPDKESVEPVEGYLYFPLDGKHKLKNLAVLYRGPTGKLDLEFEH
jgi:hypothetical protein